MSQSLRKKILGVSDRPLRESGEVPEWGFQVWIRTISAAEKMWLYDRVRDGVIPYPDLVCVGLGDEDGARVFAEGDVDAIADKNPRALAYVGELVLAHNRMRPVDLKDAEKNSEPIPSSSGS